MPILYGRDCSFGFVIVVYLAIYRVADKTNIGIANALSIEHDKRSMNLMPQERREGEGSLIATPAYAGCFDEFCTKVSVNAAISLKKPIGE